MPKCNCGKCQLADALFSDFQTNVSKLIEITTDEIKRIQPGESDELLESRSQLRRHIADLLLWTAAVIYDGEGFPASSAIYELASNFEQLDLPKDLEISKSLGKDTN